MDMEKIAIFDFDGTLIGIETFPFLIKAWTKLGHSKTKQWKLLSQVFVRFMTYKSKLKKSYHKVTFRTECMTLFLALFEGMEKHDIEKFFADAFGLMEAAVNSKVVSELRELQSQGYETVLLSGGYTPLLKVAGAKYNFSHVIGSDIPWSSEGRINYNKPMEIVIGDMKVQRIKDHLVGRNILWASSRAYADSYYDEAIFQLVGQAVAVNPDDKLRAMANQNNWRILEKN